MSALDEPMPAPRPPGRDRPDPGVSPMSGPGLVEDPAVSPPASGPGLVADPESGGGVWWGRPLAEPRCVLELARLLVDPVFRGEGIPRGDGRAVILMPGFLAGDQTLVVIAAWLRRLGYRPHVCGFVANIDCSDRAADRVDGRVSAVSRSSGGRVALIGHSRGGHYARAIAARAPDRVSHAISMGADLRGMLGISTPTKLAIAGVRHGLRVTHRARSERCVSPQCACAFTEDYSRAFPSELVRLTSIYSREDGVVRWQNSIVPEADCVEVTGSHVGLAFNRKAYRAIADALAAPELTAAG
jgi:triacylglycerol lipase